MKKPSSTLFVLAALCGAATAEPLLTSWHTEATGRYARIYETLEAEVAGSGAASITWERGRGIQTQPTYVGVHEISVTDTDVYIRSSGLGGHIMGPWFLNAAKTAPFPDFPANQALIYRLPRDPGAVPTSKTLSGLGRIGLFVDGVSMFDSRDAFSYDTSTARNDSPNTPAGVVGDGVWNRDAYVNEGVTFDAGNAHAARFNYHYHANPPALRHALGDSVDYDSATNTYTENFNGGHSPILGWVCDGYPVYGPYGFSNATDPDSPVVRMASGFRMRTITQRRTLPPHAARDQGFTQGLGGADFALPTDSYGPDITAGAGSEYELGHYLEDYEYLGDFGLLRGVDFDLDEHNGRFCVTPEFPGGTYAYFVSIEADGKPRFPYNIGRTYYGTPTGNTVTTIPAGARVLFEGGPEKSLPAGDLTIDTDGDEVTLSWSAVQGGIYLVRSSDDLSNWGAPLPDTDMDGDRLNSTDPLGENDRRFYRADLVDIAPFDDAGFVVDTKVGPGGNNVLLLIVDDWGIDSSPIDNPNAPSNPIMPTLESLAAGGLRFTNAYAQPFCSPTRATLLTGRYAFRHGIGTPAGAQLPSAEFTLPDAFAAAGSPYALASFGKWHLGGGINGPADLGGWPRFSGTLGNVSDYWDWDKTTDGVTTAVTGSYATSVQVDDAVAFITDEGDTPWFCWLAFNAPHSPFHDPDPALLPSGPTGINNRALYEKALEAMDTEIARLLLSVDLSRTNVILIGDNGTPRQTVQAPFGGGNAKGVIYEGGVRVPLVAIGPDVHARGTNDDLVHCADIYSTVLALAGIDARDIVPAGTELDSRNLFPALSGGGSISGPVVVEAFGNTIAAPGRAIRDGDYKLVILDDPNSESDTPVFEFYNVAIDINEQDNLLVDALSAAQEDAYQTLLDYNHALGGNFGNAGAGGGDTGIISIAPDSGAAGSAVTMTVVLNPDVGTRVPPLLNMAGNPISPDVTLDGVGATFVTRPDPNTIEADFILPATPGTYTIQIVFPGPNTPTFTSVNAFEVTP